MKLTVTGKGKDRRVEIEGNAQEMFWLLNAAGNAQSGQLGNEHPLDGGGVLVLVPENPAAVQAKSPTAHLAAR